MPTAPDTDFDALASEYDFGGAAIRRAVINAAAAAAVEVLESAGQQVHPSWPHDDTSHLHSNDQSLPIPCIACRCVTQGVAVACQQLPAGLGDDNRDE